MGEAIVVGNDQVAGMHWVSNNLRIQIVADGVKSTGQQAYFSYFFSKPLRELVTLNFPSGPAITSMQ
jgi:hypothetical protein